MRRRSLVALSTSAEPAFIQGWLAKPLRAGAVDPHTQGVLRAPAEGEVGWHTARNSLLPPPPRSSGAPPVGAVLEVGPSPSDAAGCRVAPV